MDFKKILARWFSHNKRDLPWRNTDNPFNIWVSEVILQQTRVVQGIGYYLRFIEEFPSVNSLAQAHEDRVLKVWQGLGYYTRARNLHSSAKLIVEEHNGIIPSSFSELRKIKGLGEYSAGAIASFAFGEAVPAIDGNVYRVLARIFGLFASPYNAAGKNEFRNLALELMDVKNPGGFNQALLDFGALQCVPQSPKCCTCPFGGYCYAHRNNLVDSLPVKAKKSTPRDRFFTYILIRCNGGTFIAKRKGKDIWQSLYEFPLIESDVLMPIDMVLNHPQWRRIFGRVKTHIQHVSEPVKHQLSHQTLHTRFVVLKICKPTAYLSKHYLFVPTSSVSDYSVPRLIDSFLAAEPAEKYFLNPPS